MTSQNLTLIPLNLKGKVYRSPMPFSAFDIGHAALQEYLDAEVDTVVMLTETGEDLRRAHRDLQQVYAENQLDTVHFPIEDFNTPDNLEHLTKIIWKIEEKARSGENIAIHCFAGRGRTGMVVALLTRKVLGLEGQAAIDWVRQFFPAIETAAQEQIVRELTLDE
ncbi:MAG: dual specificity protein phosphatase family protein [Anaerolineales bacterium]|jgi:protein-tyrosine phosphatase